eukprot:3865795-Ditylum_brightwellii.AAC.1
MFGEERRKQCRSKGGRGSIKKENETEPGDGTSTDQRVGNQPGLVLQLSGKLTNQQIIGATIYVDHATDFVYAHLMRTLSGDETLESKRTYERVAAKHKVIIKNMGAHHQNGIAENWITKLTLKSRTMLLRAKRHCPEYVTTMLWPYALKAAEAYCNPFDADKDGVSPEEKISNVCAVRSLEDEHTWGCPVYVLDSQLQDRA